MSIPAHLQTTEPWSIPSATRVGHVHLTVSNLERQIAFYTHVLGFKLHWREAAEVLLRLTENASARRVRRASGMYHFALLYPSRKELARAIARLFVLKYPNSPTDHGISKTTYLDDPEGNTIELYVRSLDDARFEVTDGQIVVRYADGRIGSGRDPLDLEALFGELDDTDPLDTPLPEGTRIGHMHLYATGLQAMMHFYRDVLGFQEGPMSEQIRMGEVGLDAQQNHVIAFNTWLGPNLPPTPADALGMRYFTLVLPSAATLEQIVARVQAANTPAERTPLGLLVRDPSHIGVILTEHLLPVDAPSPGQPAAS